MNTHSQPLNEGKDEHIPQLTTFAWVREWEGDCSDLGNFCIVYHKDDKDNSPYWIPLLVDNATLNGLPHPMEIQVSMLRNELEECKKAIEASTTALDDWINTFAPEFCEPNRVNEAYLRISDQGGTLHYVATILQENRRVLNGIERLIGDERTF